MMFQIKHYALPHPGIIPGARGHKKITIPAGTKVYCVAYRTKLYWAAYLDEKSATETAQNLENIVTGKVKRPLTLDVLLAWNFKDTIPSRIVRPKQVNPLHC